MVYVKIEPRYDPLFPKDFYDQFYDYVVLLFNSYGREVPLEARLNEGQDNFSDGNVRRANNKLLD